MSHLAENLCRLSQSYYFALLIFAFSLSMLVASGRVGNVDASDQLYAATNWVLTGKLGVVHAPGGLSSEESARFGCDVPKRLFWKARDGLYYQTHDLGNVLLLTPAAALAAITAGGSLEEQLENPPDIAKVAASLLSSLQAVACVLLVFAILRRWVPEQAAARWSAAFLVCSFFMAYTRMPWDVAGAAIFTLLAARQTLRILEHPPGSLADVVLLALAGAGVATFRYSYAPFVGLAVLIALLPSLRRIPFKHLLWALIAFAVVVAPQLYYNYLRMGSPVVPATTIPRYPLEPYLSSGTLVGMFELLFSLDLGLFIYCPVLLMLVAAWRLPRGLWLFAAGLLVSTLLYLGVIGSLPSRFWSANMGWGPRYFVPALPALFLLAVIITKHCSSLGRGIAVILAALGAAVNVPMLLANWPLVQTSLGFPEKTMSLVANPIAGMWAVIPAGITTGQHQLSGFEAGPNVTLTFPDWLIVHIGSTSLAGNVAAWFVGLTLLVLISWSLWRICAKKRLPSQ